MSTRATSSPPVPQPAAQRVSQTDGTTTVIAESPSPVARRASEPATTGRFVVVEGPQVGRRFPFSTQVVISRSAEADLRLGHDSVSRKHARVTQGASGDFVLEDLRSHNGTWVNGARITSVSLHVGDRVQLGPRTLLRFTLLDPEEDRLQQSLKMEALGRLRAGVTHDINNLLAALLMNSPDNAAVMADSLSQPSRARRTGTVLLGGRRVLVSCNPLVSGCSRLIRYSC